MKRLIIISFLASLVSLAIHFSGLSFLKYLEEDITDLKFSLRGNRLCPDEVMMVTVGQKDIEAYGQWPWRRDFVASVIQRIHEAGAEVIVLDMVMSNPTAHDKDLSHVLKGKKIVLGYRFRKASSPGEKRPPFDLRQIALDLKTQLQGVKHIQLLSEFNGVEASSPEISLSKAHQGFFTVFPDRDGIIRRSHLVSILNGYAVPFISLAAVEKFEEERGSCVVDGMGVLSLKVGDAEIPVGPDGSLRINFYGPEFTVPHIGVTDLMTGKWDMRGKLVFLGLTDRVIGDFIPTPTSPLMPGNEVLATIAANIVAQDFIVEGVSTKLLALFLVIILPLLVGVAESRLSPLWSTIFWVALLSTFLGMNLYLFSRWSILVNMSTPTLALLLAFLGTRGYRLFVLDKDAKFIRTCFQTYVSKEVLDTIVSRSHGVNLGGEERIVTCLFSDIWNFTNLSERLAPAQVVTMLNDTLGPLTETIMNQRGLVDKFIGDAIMAIFNAPLEVEDHADRAVKSAIEMINLMEKMEGIKIGVGIHSGLAVVGTMGTASRMNYTALGDTVNLASRIQGLTKEFNSYILISKQTKDMLRETYPMRVLDVVTVKGRERPVAIYQVFHKEPEKELISAAD